MKYQTIFLDLDDTLVDTAENNREALQDIYNEYNYSKYFPSFEDFFKKFQRINLHLWDLYAKEKITKDTLKITRFKKTLEEFEKITPEESLSINDSFLARVNTKKNVIRGMKDILHYLYPKYPLYILSNGFEEVQDQKMINAGIKPYFKKVILSDHIGKNKPHPALFEYALKEANADVETTIMIGDNIHTDISGAMNSGIDQIWFNPNNSINELNISPTFTVSSLDEIKNIL